MNNAIGDTPNQGGASMGETRDHEEFSDQEDDRSTPRTGDSAEDAEGHGSRHWRDEEDAEGQGSGRPRSEDEDAEGHGSSRP
jgi:hypothetical protein